MNWLGSTLDMLAPLIHRKCKCDQWKSPLIELLSTKLTMRLPGGLDSINKLTKWSKRWLNIPYIKVNINLTIVSNIVMWLLRFFSILFPIYLGQIWLQNKRMNKISIWLFWNGKILCHSTKNIFSYIFRKWKKPEAISVEIKPWRMPI